ncbi:hypothetical protein [Geobacter sulfurreducens]|uniref:hypothetical protein n=1 Tax=Geobacter sulfurreducens TaxID=35554 RepID=UPI000DBB6786|nr:hypothetical protein [Geobacter sulfurreducens]BBA71194.1 hypothetical protein YM18_2678 [Geobacter sulfurreducens]
MLELKLLEDNDRFQSYQMIIDGVETKGTEVIYKFITSMNQKAYEIRCFDKKYSKTVAENVLLESYQPLIDVSLDCDVDWGDNVSIYIRAEDYEIVFTCHPDLEKWNQYYTFQQYCNELAGILMDIKDDRIKFKTYKEESYYVNAFEITLPFEFTQGPISYGIAICSNIISNLHSKVVTALAENSTANSISLLFDFPEEVRVPCEQYLLYFAQFLLDLGVKATSNISNNGGTTLFSVTPLNREEALDKVRIALDAYLSLPSSPVSSDLDGDIFTQRLVANISHLQGQLVLAQAVLQAKDATIHAQALTISHQQQLHDGLLLKPIRRDEPTIPPENDKEDLIRDIISVTKFRGKGFEINLPEMFRQLKKLFRTGAE